MKILVLVLLLVGIIALFLYLRKRCPKQSDKRSDYSDLVGLGGTVNHFQHERHDSIEADSHGHSDVAGDISDISDGNSDSGNEDGN